MRPLLLLDFDGPLNPHRADGIPDGYERHEITEGTKTWRLLLNQQHGVELRALADTFDLVWASSWEHGANRLLAPLLGLPDLPTILWPDRRPVRRGSWKAPYVADWVGDRPFAWVDDEVGAAERTRFPHDHQLIHPVDARTGLTAADFAVLREWAGKPFAQKAFRPHS
ncbi:HAD domain-containing protein [Kribbella sp. NBC_00709]|uniref:HAD domain-containing protein n=1 Tax=Kribbella sp. NBC_00709 TaxID=2975972 RepID=UPI002E2B836B|nr:HAD domain-containing protein [Kribbella sp. NBC_00709]